MSPWGRLISCSHVRKQTCFNCFFSVPSTRVVHLPHPLPQRRPHLPHLPRRRQQRGPAVTVLLHGHAGHGAQELPGEVAVVLQHQLLRALPHGVQRGAAAAAAHRGNPGVPCASSASLVPLASRAALMLERLKRLNAHSNKTWSLRVAEGSVEGFGLFRVVKGSGITVEAVHHLTRLPAPAVGPLCSCTLRLPPVCLRPRWGLWHPLLFSFHSGCRTPAPSTRRGRSSATWCAFCSSRR